MEIKGKEENGSTWNTQLFNNRGIPFLANYCITCAVSLVMTHVFNTNITMFNTYVLKVTWFQIIMRKKKLKCTQKLVHPSSRLEFTIAAVYVRLCAAVTGFLIC